MARKLLDKLPEIVRYTKQHLNFWRDLSWHLTIGHARDWLSLHAGSPEVIEGVRAFAKQRPRTLCMTHCSHFYPQGTNLYFIFIGHFRDKEEYLEYLRLAERNIGQKGSKQH